MKFMDLSPRAGIWPIFPRFCRGVAAGAGRRPDPQDRAACLKFGGRQNLAMTRTFRHRVIVALLLASVVSSAEPQTLRFHLVTRGSVESRLGEYGGTNSEREATLKRMFVDAGCSEHVSEQPVKRTRVPNVICVLPGTSDRVVIVGAHFDRVATSQGVADNWSGASLLPSLYESVKIEPRAHTYIFIGFTGEEMGLVGSHFYARNMAREQVAATDAMVNLDTLGLAPSEVWGNRSDKRLTMALDGVATLLKLPLSSVNFEDVGST